MISRAEMRPHLAWSESRCRLDTRKRLIILSSPLVFNPSDRKISSRNKLLYDVEMPRSLPYA